MAVTTSQKKDAEQLRGYAFVVLANLSFAIGWSFVAATKGDFSAWQLIMLRGVVFVLALTPWVLRNPHVAAGANRRLLVVRGFLGTGMMVTMAYAVILVPLSMATILGKTTPFWDLLFLWLLLSLRPIFSEIVLVPVAFVGLLLILVPGGHLSIATVSYLGLIVGLASGMFNSLELITLRWLRQTDSAHTINLWYASITIVLTLPLAVAAPWPDQPMIWFFAVMFALASFAGQTLQAEAMQTITPTVASVSTLLVPAFATLIGWFVFGQVLSGLELVGITVVLAAGALVQLRESRQRDTLSTAKFRWQH